MSKEKDLFDDSTMSFGEHLEELRKRLILALLGLVIGVIFSLFFSKHLMVVMEIPVRNALIRYYTIMNGGEDPGVDIMAIFGLGQTPIPKQPATNPDGTSDAKPAVQKPDRNATTSQPTTSEHTASPQTTAPHTTAVTPAPQTNPTPVTPSSAQAVAPETFTEAEIDLRELLAALHEVNPAFPELPAEALNKTLRIRVVTPAAKSSIPISPTNLQLTALTAEEAFMVYLKVAMVAGLVLSSPWIFYQLWLFVAAGLYPHERKYVYVYLPMSLALFFGGAVFCFFAVIPFVLNFLFDFNIWLHITIEPRLTEYVSFIVILPVMFGISFQLPMVMLFLERINIFDVAAYRDKRRLAILAIAFVSMILTPSDPVSMMLMMIPLCLLYEFGILLCLWQPNANQNPFDEDKALATT